MNCKKFLIFFFVIFTVVFVSKFWHLKTGGFMTNKIMHPENYSLQVSQVPSDFKDLSIFDQEYRFLDKGCQVYVFESLDHKYVIKFIRHHKYKPHFWMRFMELCKKGRDYKNSYKEGKETRLSEVFNSYLMSYNDLREITQIIYIHIDKTQHLNRKLKVRDALGQVKYIDLDKASYIVQKKVKTFTSVMNELIKKQDMVAVKYFLDQYFEIVEYRALRKIKDLDHSGYIRNKGVLNNKIIEMDVGGYRREDLGDKEFLKMEMERFHKKMKRWAGKNIPSCLQYIDFKVQEILDE